MFPFLHVSIAAMLGRLHVLFENMKTMPQRYDFLFILSHNLPHKFGIRTMLNAFRTFFHSFLAPFKEKPYLCIEKQY